MKFLLVASLVLLCLQDAVGQEYVFPTDFMFGVATASYQVEGAWDEHDKGENIWDYMTHTFPDRIADGSTGDMACDSYHKTDEDVALLVELGVQFYRFSFSWSRIFPTGYPNQPNLAGINYYHDLIDQLDAAGIKPVPTIYHWDLPQPLQEIGGWMNPLIQDHFVAYANRLFEEYASKVEYWVTINEPASVCLGYGEGSMAPGYTQDGRGSYLCGHNLLLAHAYTYKLFQENYAGTYPDAKIGMAINSRWHAPADEDSTDDVAAALRRRQWTLGWFAHPIFSTTGDYPEVMRDRIYRISLEEEFFSRTRLPTFTSDEIELIRGSADFFGLNHYTSELCTSLNDNTVARPSNTYDSGASCAPDASWGTSASSWLRVYPEGLRHLLVWINENYDNPDVFILENGFSDTGTLAIEDCNRIDYYNDYLEQLLYAMVDDGCNVIGYTAWSFLDNFEWAQGYTEKFGLVTVDFDSEARTRTKKPSFYAYQTIIDQRAIVPGTGCSI